MKRAAWVRNERLCDEWMKQRVSEQPGGGVEKVLGVDGIIGQWAAHRSG